MFAAAGRGGLVSVLVVLHDCERVGEAREVFFAALPSEGTAGDVRGLLAQQDGTTRRPEIGLLRQAGLVVSPSAVLGSLRHGVATPAAATGGGPASPRALRSDAAAALRSAVTAAPLRHRPDVVLHGYTEQSDQGAGDDGRASNGAQAERSPPPPRPPRPRRPPWPLAAPPAPLFAPRAATPPLAAPLPRTPSPRERQRWQRLALRGGVPDVDSPATAMAPRPARPLSPPRRAPFSVDAALAAARDADAADERTALAAAAKAAPPRSPRSPRSPAAGTKTLESLLGGLLAPLPASPGRRPPSLSSPAAPPRRLPTPLGGGAAEFFPPFASRGAATPFPKAVLHSPSFR